MSNWKKVEEELPVNDKDIIFTDKFYGNDHFGFYAKYSNMFCEQNDDKEFEPSKVLAWCYVPEYDL